MRKKELSVFLNNNISERMEQNKQFESAVNKALNRFTHGDYGDIGKTGCEIQKMRLAAEGIACGEYKYGNEGYIHFTRINDKIEVKFYERTFLDDIYEACLF